MPTILALDVGTKRIGLAVSDPGMTFALPIATLTRQSLAADLTSIRAYIQEYAVDEIVVGDPVTLGGERGLAAERIDAFVAKLRAAVSVPVARIDERLTTAQATKSLIAADYSRTRRKAVVDRVAATLMLETYLAQRLRERP